MSTSLQLAVVGATSLVGQAILELLAERNFPAARVFAVDVAEQDGSTVSFGNLELDVHMVDEFNFENVGMAIFAAGSAVSREYAPQARDAGAAVVDFSSAFRADAGVPLVAPAINAAELEDLGRAPLVAVPNCTTTPLALALAALLPLGVQRASIATYQAVSGSGQAAMEEMADQTTALFSHRDAEVKAYDKRIAFNVLPQIGELDENGDSEEERSVRDETARLLGLAPESLEVTCARVPVFFGHSWAVQVELHKEFDLEQVKKRLQAAGLKVVGRDQHGGYVTPMEATGNELVWVSRLRAHGKVVSMWLSADNVKAGAAIHCVRIAEILAGQSPLM
ncbi:aspartate-semialdehyde dehydrogenase [Chromobacterium subtsugae]|mgnify:CR=1 FL=1|uniref:Aspartate-semialdehyde dehydrogenase n=1 Tax=Chromobacterium subtsugae TaxID=251747 RepID=A0ABS7FJA7_9NEIS|nr:MULTISPECIES: aspartate-semialdehyde dehydrogenase [Chromobacterium]KUM02900.1 aspartate-semialdehyde dehydrogenase [Chromobacterium subtsugae]KZE84116.1 aspartate-semialdehyde dehydrogenase [Chromobacterium sp. F49]MBW7568640.1 aspartate-semialdehyde dehydrogenase [Chromobacterium subtsugae]MBW8290153.1 aspartate-semialdehyde dehydrogenase [Chromobacterium subtsugae]WSE93624.1 aspartate-semialdehyde dehydrogenase [Chromobacterium subtsugae]